MNRSPVQEALSDLAILRDWFATRPDMSNTMCDQTVDLEQAIFDRIATARSIDASDIAAKLQLLKHKESMEVYGRIDALADSIAADIEALGGKSA